MSARPQGATEGRPSSCPEHRPNATWATSVGGEIQRPTLQKRNLRPRGGHHLQAAEGSCDEALAAGGRGTGQEKSTRCVVVGMQP